MWVLNLMFALSTVVNLFGALTLSARHRNESSMWRRISKDKFLIDMILSFVLLCVVSSGSNNFFTGTKRNILVFNVWKNRFWEYVISQFLPCSSSKLSMCCCNRFVSLESLSKRSSATLLTTEREKVGASKKTFWIFHRTGHGKEQRNWRMLVLFLDWKNICFVAGS